MTRTLTVTAAALASQDAEGRVWLVGEGVTWGTAHLQANHPSVEFALASAPCETCENEHTVLVLVGDEGEMCVPCPDCRIELEITDGFAFPVVVGHAYAVGQPLPIRNYWGDAPSIAVDLSGGLVGLMKRAANKRHECIDLTAALAHYGPPESLVGKWALQLAVTP